MVNNVKIQKTTFRAGYQSALLSAFEVARSLISYESYKFLANYIIRDGYSYLRHFDSAVYDEYERNCDQKRMYANSALSVASLDDAVARVFKSLPENAHTYFLSKSWHLLLFCRGTRVAPPLLLATKASLERALRIQDTDDCWPYPAELMEPVYVAYECLQRGVWPPTSLIRHVYAFFGAMFNLKRSDLTRCVGGGFAVLKPHYEELFPLEFKDILKFRSSNLNNVMFDDTVAFYKFLQCADLLKEYTVESLSARLFKDIDVIIADTPDFFELIGNRFRQISAIENMADPTEAEEKQRELLQEILQQIRNHRRGAIAPRTPIREPPKDPIENSYQLYLLIKESEDAFSDAIKGSVWHRMLRMLLGPLYRVAIRFGSSPVWMSMRKVEAIEARYKGLTALEKLTYVTLANAATSDDIAYAVRTIAPIFEREMLDKRGFLEAHD